MSAINIKIFKKRAGTWERAYEHPGSVELGGPYMVFFNPRLFKDSEFWRILNADDSAWKLMVEKAFRFQPYSVMPTMHWLV